MTTRIGRIFILLAPAAGLLPAQQGRIAGPVPGYVFDSAARALRPILGIPGASLVGGPVDFGLDVASAWVAPRQDAALVAGADGSLHVFRLVAGVATERAFDGRPGMPDRVDFSPSGSAAALYYAGGAVQVITGLPDSPAPAGAFSLGAARLRTTLRDRPPRTVRPALAVSDDGTLLVAALEGEIRVLDSNGGNRALMEAGPRALAAFAPGGHDAAVVDAGAGVVLFRDVAGAAVRQAISAPDDAIASAAGLAFSTDGHRLFVASATARSVAAFDLATAARGVVPCDCAPETLVAMGGLFRLNELGPAPLWLLDAGTSPESIVFVPVEQPSAPAAR